MQAQLSDIEALVERVREARLRDIVKQGIGYLHEGMHPGDQDIIHTLFQSGAIQVCLLLPSFVSHYNEKVFDIAGQIFPTLPLLHVVSRLLAPLPNLSCDTALQCPSAALECLRL